MIRTRGKKAGEKLVLHQFCNDWISADDSDGRPVIVNPTSVQLEPGEAEVMLADKNPGFFWKRYRLTPDHLRLIKLKRVT